LEHFSQAVGVAHRVVLASVRRAILEIPLVQAVKLIPGAPEDKSHLPSAPQY